MNNFEIRKFKAPSIFSFFSGAGFLDLGFENAGYDVVYVNEIHPPFLDAYKYSRQKMGHSGPKFAYFEGSIDSCFHGSEEERLDRCVVQEKKAGKLVGFIGGPPCPDFSVGGKNKGKEGENGRLSQSYVNLICKVKPDFFVFENVKGLWRTARHRQFYEGLKHQLEVNGGYQLTENLIDAIEFGTPQTRERIILFGIRTGKDISTFDWNTHKIFNRGIIKQDFWPVAESPQIDRDKPKGIPEQLTVQYWFDKNNVTEHPNAKHHFIPRAGLKKFKVTFEGDDSKKSYKRLHRWRFSPTAAYGNNEVHIHPYLPRRISASEALSIQSLPSEFALPPEMTLSNMFKTIGNGVPYLASLGLARTIKGFLVGEE